LKNVQNFEIDQRRLLTNTPMSLENHRATSTF